MGSSSSSGPSRWIPMRGGSGRSAPRLSQPSRAPGDAARLLRSSPSSPSNRPPRTGVCAPSSVATWEPDPATSARALGPRSIGSAGTPAVGAASIRTDLSAALGAASSAPDAAGTRSSASSISVSGSVSSSVGSASNASTGDCAGGLAGPRVSVPSRGVFCILRRWIRNSSSRNGRNSSGRAPMSVTPCVISLMSGGMREASWRRLGRGPPASRLQSKSSTT